MDVKNWYNGIEIESWNKPMHVDIIYYKNA